jgi:uncharacterized protein YjiS (DUF1127 family)
MHIADECDETAAYYLSQSTAPTVSARRAMKLLSIARHWAGLANEIRRLTQAASEEEQG